MDNFTIEELRTIRQALKDYAISRVIAHGLFNEPLSDSGVQFMNDIIDKVHRREHELEGTSYDVCMARQEPENN